MDKPGKAAGYWEQRAKGWDLIGPPLRPSPEDIGIMAGMIDAWHREAEVESPNVLILGVTPEIATMKWPPGTRVLAVEISLSMIRDVWPGSRVPYGTAVCADWLTMPVEDGSFDAAVGDGSISLLSYPQGLRQLSAELLRVLRPGGLFVVRIFSMPDQPEAPETVFEELWAGRIWNFNAFKWRLAMALHEDPSRGVTFSHIWDVWNRAVPEPELLAQTLGWPREVIRTMDAYRQRETRYTFPRVAEVCEVLSPHFKMEACVYPDYADGRRYPTLLFRRTP